MTEEKNTADDLLASLQERAKELNCLYEVEQILSRFDLPLEEAFAQVIRVIPPGWQYPDICHAIIEFEGKNYNLENFRPTPWVQSAEIIAQDQVVGNLSVWYLEERPEEDSGPFLKEEERLIRTIAERLGHSILFHRMHAMRQEWEEASRELEEKKEDRWRGPIELLRRSDRDLYLRVARKMVNHLCWAGADGGQDLLQEIYGASPGEEARDANYPARPRTVNEDVLLSGKAFELARSVFGGDEVLALTRDWIMEDKASFLPKVLNNPRATLSEVGGALRRFHHLLADGAELPRASLNGILVSLIRRFLTEQLAYISIAKEYIQTEDFIELLDRVILSSAGHGKLGGKSSGLFLAERILRRNASSERPIGEIKVPRSWYVASEGMMSFIEFNDLEEVLQQKYREISLVRQEFPNILQLFKNSRFPAEIVKGVSMILDEVGDAPLIVRSSSLLEDRLGSAFSGKYRSLFLGNQGSKRERMSALLDAMSEVYASVFGPDPIAYRRERGLIDFHEEMAILIQEVVGTKVGGHFLPAMAGVAFSNNEFRWSQRIRREDGLIRLVPGLGTRAVDRVSDDYPILAVPGQPGLRVNTTIEEVARYSPRRIDVINLETNSFETLDIKELLESCGASYPFFENIFSILKDDVLHKPVPMLVDVGKDELVADFGGLIDSTPFVKQIGNVLQILEETLGTPVDIEFAHDGKDFFLLQCRPQSFTDEDAPAPIPKDVPAEDTIFTAHRYVSNGQVPDITHVVYVDPESYGRLADRSELLAVGEAVGKLNKLLPKRRFILMGPGRWGSRGDIKLGVSVSYSDINNTAMLIEIARKTGEYLPDLSFGTHFFQDLVEASIRYLPLYPDDDGSLNQRFLYGATNLLPAMLPEHEGLADVMRVIDVSSASGGRVLRVLMNSDLDEAIAILAEPESTVEGGPVRPTGRRRPQPEVYWRWRMGMAERIAAELDPERFGVAAFYVIGSTKNANAGPSSDIDLLIHCRGDDDQRRDLEAWLEGWSICLGEMNHQRTGYPNHPLLDVHLISDEDIAKSSSFAAKIGAVTDPALELPIGPAVQK
ncbi:MAG: PEP/pyruvate-binding domain-containing protein [Thermoanaerobaculales bacterium]